MIVLKKTFGNSLKKAKSMSPKKVIEKIKNSGLTGRGGAGFPTGLKWEFTRKASGEKYLICNADEGEPGTFKDKFIIQKNPETLVEGILIGCYALSAKKAYIYLRGEYFYLKKYLQRAIAKLKAEKKIKIISGAGAYICGEETSIMNSIEGSRGIPRHKPPYPAQKGLWQNPTCINNVETLTNVALLFNKNWNKNYRLFSISGNVANPGVFEEKLGITMDKLIKKAKPKGKIKAISFGAAGGIIPWNKSIILNKERIGKTGATLGSCTIIVISEKHCIVNFCKNITEFFVHESCGKCTPCREGNYRLVQLLNKITDGRASKADIRLLEDISYFIRDASFCALGQSSTTHLITALKYFKKEFQRKCR